MNVRFFGRNGKKECTIQICIFNSRTEFLKVNTEHKLPVEFWDTKNQKAKQSMDGAEELNEILLLLKLDVLKQIRIRNLNGINDWTQIKIFLANYLKTKRTSTKNDDSNLSKIESSHKRNPNTRNSKAKKTDTSKKFYIEEVISKFLRARSAEYKPETVRKYGILQSVWKHFETYKKQKFLITDLSFEIMEEFRLYLLNVRNNRNDTIYKMLACLKSLLHWLIRNNYHIDLKCFELKQKVKVKHDIVTLSEDEVERIRQVELSSELNTIRDCFLFQLHTGQRYSDMQQLIPEQIKNDYWEFTQIKTGKEMLVPLVGWSQIAIRIASKYNFKFPHYTPQYFNRALKLVCRNAGITESVTLSRFKGTNTVLIKKQKCDLVSSHTARRTAVSILLEKGIPPTVVMKMTGHSSIQTMMRYERTSNKAVYDALIRINQ